MWDLFPKNSFSFHSKRNSSDPHIWGTDLNKILQKNTNRYCLNISCPKHALSLKRSTNILSTVWHGKAPSQQTNWREHAEKTKPAVQLTVDKMGRTTCSRLGETWGPALLMTWGACGAGPFVGWKPQTQQLHMFMIQGWKPQTQQLHMYRIQGWKPQTQQLHMYMIQEWKSTDTTVTHV